MIDLNPNSIALVDATTGRTYVKTNSFSLSISIRASGHSKLLSEIRGFFNYLFVSHRWVARRKRVNKIKEKIDQQIKGENE